MRGESFWTQDANTGPRTFVQQFESDDRIDGGLPHHGLIAVFAHRPLVVHHVVVVRRAGLTILASASHPQPRTGLATHLVAQRCGVRQTSSHNVARADRLSLDHDRGGAVQAKLVQRA